MLIGRMELRRAPLLAGLVRGTQPADIIEAHLVHPCVPRTGIISVPAFELLEEANHARSAQSVAKGFKALAVNLI
jgi:hypothetical protein